MARYTFREGVNPFDPRPEAKTASRGWNIFSPSSQTPATTPAPMSVPMQVAMKVQTSIPAWIGSERPPQTTIPASTPAPTHVQTSSTEWNMFNPSAHTTTPASTPAPMQTQTSSSGGNDLDPSLQTTIPVSAPSPMQTQTLTPKNQSNWLGDLKKSFGSFGVFGAFDGSGKSKAGYSFKSSETPWTLDTIRSLGSGKTTVNVIGGALTGASVEVGSSSTCGSGADCDIVLLHPQVAAKHFDLKMKSPWSRQVRLTATGGPIRIANQQIEKGQWVDTKLPAEVDVADIKLRIDHSVNLTGAALQTGLIALTLLCIAGAAFTGWTISDYVADRTIAASTPAPQEAAPAPTKSATDGLPAIKAKLQELNLFAQVEATAATGGNIQLSGAIGTEEVQQWREFLKWYDGSKLPPLLNSVDRIESPTALPRIAAISYGKVSKVFLTDGREIKVGETMGQNLIVKSIERDAIVVSRGADVITLRPR